MVYAISRFGTENYFWIFFAYRLTVNDKYGMLISSEFHGSVPTEVHMTIYAVTNADGTPCSMHSTMESANDEVRRMLKAAAAEDIFLTLVVVEWYVQP